MKRLIVSLVLAQAFLISNAIAENKKGQEIFEAKGCAICHKVDIDAIGPSLKTIGEHYLGKEGSLLAYLKGQGTPIVDPARAAVMNPQLIKIRSLFEDEMNALAEHMVSANDRPF